MHSSRSRVCVYCGSRSGAQPAYKETARALGRGLANHGIGLIYGGGAAGLMGALADAALAENGEVIGVIPRALFKRDLAHNGLSELIVVDDMPQRKAQMAARAQAIIGLPGGLGTLEEMSEALSWAQLDLHDKPICLLNVDGYFDALISFLQQAVIADFLQPEHQALLRVFNEVDPLLATLRDGEII